MTSSTLTKLQECPYDIISTLIKIDYPTSHAAEQQERRPLGAPFIKAA